MDGVKVRKQLSVVLSRLAENRQMYSLEFRIGKPASKEEVDAVEKAIERPIPVELRAMFVGVTRLLYVNWELDEDYRVKLSNGTIYAGGGGTVWSLDELPELLKIWAVWAKGNKSWEGKFPVMQLPNSDFLAIGPDQRQEPRLFYMNHEDDEVESTSFMLNCGLAEFMGAWIDLGFVGPEWWTIEPLFYSEEDRRLRTDSPVALRIRRELGLP